MAKSKDDPGTIDAFEEGKRRRGRPPIFGAPMSAQERRARSMARADRKRVELMLPSAVVRSLDAVAEELGLSRSEVVTLAIGVWRHS